jgi:hypothetical protein
MVLTEAASFLSCASLRLAAFGRELSTALPMQTSISWLVRSGI